MWSSSFILQKKTMTTREAMWIPMGHTAWVIHDIVQTSEHQFLYVWLTGSLFDNTTNVNLEFVWTYTLPGLTITENRIQKSYDQIQLFHWPQDWPLKY